MTEKKHYRYELIGKTLKALSNDVVFEGKAIDETKSTLVIETKRGKKTLLKNNLTITKIDNDELLINGKKINVRPHERVKLR